jgi:hypothetical protein
LLTLRTKRQTKNCLDVGKQNGKKNQEDKKNVEHHITIIQNHLYYYKLIIHEMWETQLITFSESEIDGGPLGS